MRNGGGSLGLASEASRFGNIGRVFGGYLIFRPEKGSWVGRQKGLKGIGSDDEKTMRWGLGEEVAEGERRSTDGTHQYQTGSWACMSTSIMSTPLGQVR